MKNKLAELEKVENELSHLHDDIREVKNVQTNSDNNKEQIEVIKSQISGLTRKNVMVDARVSGVYDIKG